MYLNVEKLILNRGERRILGPLDIRVEAGGFLAVRGPNGAGKSTLLRAIAGLLKPESGTIEIAGDAVSEDLPYQEHCHYFGHLDGLKTALTVAENLLFFQDLYGGETHLHSVDEALDIVALPRTRDLPVAYLSAGMRKRVAIARLLLNHRQVWLLDEPTSALDAASQDRLGVMMQSHLDTGGIIVAATHLPLPGAISDVLEIEPSQSYAPELGETWL
ncbi:MAG: heme ABC exporter ATP-binding protein CcmA [Hyphomicrobiales bacterium]